MSPAVRKRGMWHELLACNSGGAEKPDGTGKLPK